MAISRGPLHPDVIYRGERCFVALDINPNTLAHPLTIL